MTPVQRSEASRQAILKAAARARRRGRLREAEHRGHRRPRRRRQADDLPLVAVQGRGALRRRARPLRARRARPPCPTRATSRPTSSSSCAPPSTSSTTRAATACCEPSHSRSPPIPRSRSSTRSGSTVRCTSARRRACAAPAAGELGDVDLDVAVELIWSPLAQRWLNRGPLTHAFADAVVETALARPAAPPARRPTHAPPIAAIASASPSSSWAGPIATAETTGMPSVIPTCWLSDVSPVARPCSRSGTPEVATTMKPTIATRLATPPANIATSSGTIHTPSVAERDQRERRRRLHEQPAGDRPARADARDHARPEHPAQHRARAEHGERGARLRAPSSRARPAGRASARTRARSRWRTPAARRGCRQATVRRRTTPQRHERLRDPRLDGDEGDEQRGRGEQRDRRLDDAVDEREQRERHQQRAGDVETRPARRPSSAAAGADAPRPRRGAALRERERRDREHGRRHEDVDEEGPAPAQRVGQQPAERRRRW